MSVLVADVLATELLAKREDDHAAHVKAPPSVQRLPSSLNAVETLCEGVRLACNADSAGISVFHHPSYAELTWLAVVGACASFQGRRYPLRHSMCGVCFDAGKPLLFQEAQRYFQWMGMCGIRVAEGLVVPMRTPAGTLFGTLWCLTHHTGTKVFSGLDVRHMLDAVNEIYSALCRETRASPALFDSQCAQGDAFSVERRVAYKC